MWTLYYIKYHNKYIAHLFIYYKLFNILQKQKLMCALHKEKFYYFYFRRETKLLFLANLINDINVCFNSTVYDKLGNWVIYENALDYAFLIET